MMDFSKRDTTVIKGIAICLMVWHHLFTFAERLIEVEFISLPFINGLTLASSIGQFGKLCVAIFALLSGYGTYLSCRNTNADRATAKHILKMYKMFWSVFFIAVPVSLLLGTVSPEHFWEDFIYSAIGLRFTYCNEWWFITPLAILIIFSPFIIRFIDRPGAKPIKDFIILSLVNAYIFYILPKITELPVFLKLDSSFFWLELYTTHTLFPAFASGCLIAKYDIFSKVKQKCTGRVHIAGTIPVLLGLFLIHPFNWMLYDHINAALFVCCMIVLLGSRIGSSVSRIFEILGNESTLIWLVHTLFCYYWCQKLVFAPRYSILIFLWLLALSFASAKLIKLFWSLMERLYTAVFKPRTQT